MKPFVSRGLCISQAVLVTALLVALAGCEREEGAVVPAVGEREAQPAAAVEGPVQTERVGDQLRQYIMYPTGEKESSVLLIEKLAPERIVAGQPYQYQIKVTNLTDAPLAGVRVSQQVPAHFEIDQSEPMAQETGLGEAQLAGERQQPQQQQMGQQQMGQQPTGQQPQRQQQQQRPQQQQLGQPQQPQQPGQQPPQIGQPQQQQQRGQGQPATQPGARAAAQQQQPGQPTTQPGQGQQQAQQQQQEQMRTVQWNLGDLGPNETRTITVTGYAGNVGQLSSCITAAYQPALCTVTEIVNPQLRLTKEAPQSVLACEPITFRYVVANEGTGAARDVIITDPLPEGLVTAEGENQVRIEVGELPAGQQRDFTVQVQANRTGELGSRAIARSDAGEVGSSRVTTLVRQPQLAVNVEAPEWSYTNQRINYRVTVRNTSEVAARDAVLSVRMADGIELVENPALAEGDAQLAAARQGPEGEFDLGVLEPGESRSVNLVLRGSEAGQKEIAAAVAAFCAEAAADTAQIQIAAIPALHITVVDAEDPVQVGGETTYTITVANEGTGVARDLRLQAQMPQGMRFIGGEGASKLAAQGNQLNFEPLPQLAPGATAQWQVRVSAQQPGSTQFRVRMMSRTLDQPVIASEPTQFY